MAIVAIRHAQERAASLLRRMLNMARTDGSSCLWFGC